MPDSPRNRLKTTVSAVASSGLGAFTISAAVSGFRTFVAGDDGKSFSVSITEGTTSEERTGCVYTHSGTSLARGTLESSSTGSAITFTSACIVTVTLTAGHDQSLINAQTGFIEGLTASWVSATQLGAGSGACYIESLGTVVSGAPANITPSSPANSTWYHVYSYSNAGVLTLEASTTAPVAFATASGTARSKSGDTSRRYLYSAKTDGAGAFFNFVHSPVSDYFSWVGAVNAAPFRVLAAGTATSSTSVDCSAVAPVTARMLVINFINSISATASTYVSSGDFTVSATNFTFGLGPGQIQFGFCPCNATQLLAYITTAASPATYIDVFGFLLSR